MPKVIVQANQTAGDAGATVLSERVLSTHLEDGHYAAQLIERLAWAASDAERLESRAEDEQVVQPGLRPTRPPGEPIACRPPTSPIAGDGRGRT